MRPRRRATALGLATTTALVVSMITVHAPSASADPGEDGDPPVAPGPAGDDTVDLDPDLAAGKRLPLDRQRLRAAERRLQAQQEAAAADAVPGDTKLWLALDDVTGQIYAKPYTLRGLGEHIQLWVADDRAFPDGDCRNDLGLTEITDAQVTSFVTEFDENIYPAESAAFSVAPDRDGTGAPLAGVLGQPADYYQVSADQADDVVALVDNVIDANYYDPSSPDGQTYIAGFHYSVFNEYVNRNVMTIDAFDWLHRTGANPPDDSADPAYVACTGGQGQTRPYGTPRPLLYEGTFAHEYQHLLEYYEDPDEYSWVNEGLSDYAQTLVGYVDPSIPPEDEEADGHLKCFAGFQPESFGGPENSLTLWEDQGGPEVLCDYGAAYSFMQYLVDHHGERAMTLLHREDANGLEGLDAVLDQVGSRTSAMQTIRDWAAMVALDRAVDRSRTLLGGDRRALTSRSLSYTVNWDNPQAYESPGAPPNGSDYVRLRDARGRYLDGRRLRSVRFAGSPTLPTTPVEWQVAATPPAGTDGATCATPPAAGTGPAALYSGCGESLDRSIVREVSVPAGGGQLSFETLYDIEQAWDFGFVQVSTDGGATWTSLATEGTTSEADPGADPRVLANLPGFSGESGGWTTQHADLAAYAGQDVLVGFRYLTDGAVDESGFWVRNVDVAGTALPTDTLEGWQTMSQANPTEVAGYTVQLIASDARGRSAIVRLRVGEDGTAVLSRSARRTLAALAGSHGKGHDRGRKGKHRGHRHGSPLLVAALVMQDDPAEGSTQYARYRLTANGVLQPGG